MVVMKHSEMKRFISLLRERIEDPNLDSRSRGLLGNLLGELKSLENDFSLDKDLINSDAQEVLSLWRSDPVIQAYLHQKSDLEEKIRHLELMLDSSDDD